MKPTAAILTISDSSAKGLRQDASGPALRRVLEEAGFEVVHSHIVPDDIQAISAALVNRAQRARFVVTTGGTGVGPRDVTPEATRSVCDRLLDGVAERMRAEGAKHTMYAALSRGVCGTRGTSLILNLPGNPAGAEQSLKSVLDLVPHALDLLAGKTEHK
ncbi:MAG TPA: MogA/MoaB family molybdenum cofactor biosynthesis protein [Terriglobales bacterium]|nr:MogA/MoaB family molybdenum cofactor biosynthesis protein [Terriglobales bacterium]